MGLSFDSLEPRVDQSKVFWREKLRDSKPSEQTRPEVTAELVEEIRRSNKLIEQWLVRQNDWRKEFMLGVLRGLGAVLGATLVVSILLNVIRPLQQFKTIGPVMERIANALEDKPR